MRKIGRSDHKRLDFVIRKGEELIVEWKDIEKFETIVLDGDLTPKEAYVLLSHIQTTNYDRLLFEHCLKEPVLPPSSAVLFALLPTEISEDVIANLNTVFQEIWLSRHGISVARRIWRTQACSIIIWHWLSSIISIVDRAKRLTTGQ